MSGFDVERLEALADDGWLRRQRHPEADLWIYNYTEKTQYENHWTPETLACRGLILNAFGEIIARPFPKFFNYGTPQVGELPQESFTVSEKIDGSLGILYALDGRVRVATRGSFVSDQAKEAMAMLPSYDFQWVDGLTPLVEIVYPQNRIVVDYGSRRELVLLAVLENETGEEAASRIRWTGPTTTYHHRSLDELVADERPNAEGYVVTFESGLRVKIKHAEYVRLHRIITGVNSRHIWDALRQGDDLDALLDGVPDEIHNWITTTRIDLRCAFEAERDQALRILDERPGTHDRGTIARYFQASGGNTGVLFRMLDGKDYDDLIWKAIKPEPTTPDTIWTEAAA